MHVKDPSPLLSSSSIYHLYLFDYSFFVITTGDNWCLNRRCCEVHSANLSIPTSTKSLSSINPYPLLTWETADVWSRGIAKSIPLTVTLDALLPIPSLRPFAPASFMLMRRRAPTEDRMAGFPTELTAISSGVLDGKKSDITVPALTNIKLGIIPFSILSSIYRQWTYAIKYTTWSRRIILTIFVVFSPGSSFKIWADLYTASVIKSIP